MPKKAPKTMTSFRLNPENDQFLTDTANMFGFSKTQSVEFFINTIRNEPELFIDSFAKNFQKLTKKS
jgi:hypothetical protein